MQTKNTAIALFCGFLITLSVTGPSRLMAQADAGPMAPPPQSQSASSRPAAAPRAKPPVVLTRTTLDGAWKLNHDASDDPRTKTQGGMSNNNNCGGGYPGGGYPGGGYPYPGGPMGGGYPYPGGGGGPCGRSNPRQDAQLDKKLQDMIRPASSLSIALKDKAEVDLTDDQYHKLVFFTDGRQLQKPKDDTYQEIAAHWSGDQLISDEKSPQGVKMSRTFELSQNGQQLYETVHVDAVKSKPAVYLSYVYDIPPRQPTHQTDPDQPVMRRRSDDSASASGAGNNGQTDSNQTIMRRNPENSDNSSSTQTQSSQTTTSGSTASPPPQTTQPSSESDPDQPVMKRRAGSDSSSQ